MNVHRIVALTCAALATPALAQVFDVRVDWSNTSNPNGAWSYREGDNPLAKVIGWQNGCFGGWSTPQDGWADDACGNNRLPFWYRSNGTENFSGADIQAGDVIVHTFDPTNGVGNGEARLVWTAPTDGSVDITGSIWLARNIGRSNDWTILINGEAVSTGTVSDGDPYSRANPMNLTLGSGGASVLNNRHVCAGSTVTVEMKRTPGFSSGEFTGINLQIDFTATGPCYADCDLDCKLSIDDFICFQTLFALGDPSADCDGDAFLSIDDFICFQTLFAIGC